MTTDEMFKLLVVLAKEAANMPRPLDRKWPYEPKRGDLVVETTALRGPDPDAIGWLIGEGLAPWGVNDPPTAPMRHVWDIRPLNPGAVLTDGRLRWENATFRVVPPWIAEKAGIECPIFDVPEES